MDDVSEEGRGGSVPPSGNTGASVTGEVGVHWLAGVSLATESVVLDVVERVTGAGRERRPRGALGYSRRWRVGGVTVLAGGQGPYAASMGCHVEVSGEGCEELGLSGLVEIYQELGLRASRIDLAVDGCPFTPAQVWASWTAGQVRTKVKVASDAVEGREWRSGEWVSSSSGDTAYLGAGKAARRARVYDRRETGTRLELQMRHRAAAAVASDVLDGEVGEGWALRVLGHVRAFVDFVEVEGAHSSRRSLLPWWSAFVGHVERSKVKLCGEVVDTFEAAAAWIDHQVAPLLAVYESRLGADALRALVDRGRLRWRSRHTRLVMGAGAVTAS